MQKLPLDHVKIDKSFVQSADQDPRAHEITLTIVRLCSSFGMGCIAEGVETAAQLEMLSKIGCHTLQGYYFAKPMSAKQVNQYIAENTPMISIGIG
ncbi:cyclic-guanylate-specific phosphodiesterase (plasmid) [Maritalea myrionectae]|uniref:Cyclic-guanylate-specific phosphodiesterase n=1 Tax=Maritalea myrionectae TaxID=454601 RepID=A0A2R4MIS4_9HYPH|nr:cyclic-guanylate-specific phosphodiesterase [Maritalea myrionectae]